MRKELLQMAADLSRRGEPFVVATVVRRESFSSAQVGDTAVITVDGGYHGWLGGSCTQPAVKREAARAIADGLPRLVSLSPEPDPHPRSGVTALPMTCHSGGTVDIYIEPVLPAPRLVIFGTSPVARTLAQLAKAMGYGVDQVDVVDGVDPAGHAAALRAGPAPHVVVATMGDNDEDAVAAALLTHPAYLGVVASRKRFAILRETLLGRGVAAAALDRIKSPAGLDLGGRGPEEVALSILAEIVQGRRAAPASETLPVAPSPAEGPPEQPDEQIDPVCSMRVKVAGARHTGQWNGRTWYFCNPRCKDKFLADPHRYLDSPAPPTLPPASER